MFWTYVSYVTVLIFICAFSIFSKNVVFDLTKENWILSNKNGSISVPNVPIPGMVHTHLYNAGKIADPYYRKNDVYQRWVSNDEWEYTARFSFPKTLLAFKKNLLVFKGLDTVAQITLNGKEIASSDNMFREYSFDISDALVEENVLVVKFLSAIKEAKRRRDAYPYECPFSPNDEKMAVQHGEKYRNYIRKGIYRDLFILSVKEYYIDYFRIDVLPKEKSFSVLTSVFFESYVDLSHKSMKESVVVSIPELQIEVKREVDVRLGDNRCEINFDVPHDKLELWWPNGYGQQKIYEIVVTMGSGETQSKNIGFRDVQVIQEDIPGKPDEKTFHFLVNGVKIYAKGGNFIPMDSFDDRVKSNDLERMMKSLTEAHNNMIRVWGGGLYQKNEFYDLTDKYGLLVWQEFMYACALYPTDGKFLENVQIETEVQIRRLKHHPSIALWSGSNENEVSLWDHTWYHNIQQDPDSKSIYLIDYAKLYFETIRPVLLREDPTRFFWPSSPSNGIISTDPYVGKWDDPKSTSSGDVHFYSYLEDCTDVSIYPKGKFISEYGFQGFPTFSVLKKVTIEEDWSWDSDVMMHRQHRLDGQKELRDMMARYFKYPDLDDPLEKFRSEVYLSQLVQVFCAGTETEYYRTLMNSHHTMGSLYWMLNDIWQAPTWASLNYEGAWKPLHYEIERAFNPILVTSHEDTGNGHYLVFVVNDLYNDVDNKLKGEIEIDVDIVLEMYSWSSGKLLSRKNYTEENIGYLESRKVLDEKTTSILGELNCIDPMDCVLFLVAKRGNDTVSRNHHFFAPLKDSHLQKPTISLVSIEKYQEMDVKILLKSNVLTPFVYFDVEYEGKFSENVFFLFPNEEKTVVFENWEDSLDLDRFKNSLFVKSVRDTYK